jgi:hypothetical protein
MGAQQEIARILRDFYDRKIDNLNIYLPGFGGLFVGRTKDGIAIGYSDKNKHFGNDDHATVLFDKQGIKGIHRTVSDDYSVVYMKPNVEYIIQANGMKNLLQEIQRKGKMPLPAQAVWMMVFRALNWASESGTTMSKNLTLLTEEQAAKLGMSSPCLYLEPQLNQKLIIPLYNILIRFQNLYFKMFGKKPTSGFTPGDFPGLRTTKYPKKRKT